MSSQEKGIQPSSVETSDSDLTEEYLDENSGQKCIVIQPKEKTRYKIYK